MGGAITRAVEDQYQLGMRALGAQVADLRTAIAVLETRCALRPGQITVPAPHVAGGPRQQSRRPVRGYASAAQRFSKTRRLAGLRERLAAAEAALATGRPSITVGGKRLWRTRHNLGAANMTEQQWQDRWDASRMFMAADGETGKVGGNETIRVDEHGRLRIKVPVALTDRFGTHLHITAPVTFNHRRDEWADRVGARRAVRYDITFDPQRRRWYLDASWTITPQPAPELDDLRGGRGLGVDLNTDHLAACVLDTAGNPVGEPVTIPVDTAGLGATRRDGRVRAAITCLLDHTDQHSCTAIVVENLDFADVRATGRETLGTGKRGKRLRRTVAAIPTAKFRSRLTAMASRRGVAVIGVDPAYTGYPGSGSVNRTYPGGVEAPELIALLAGRCVAVLTGAGVSTDSGIPDYRGPDSPPSNPMTIRQFSSDPVFRQRYWARNHIGWRHMDHTLPNAGHRALAALERAGSVAGVITQNVDLLHTKAGSREVINLHGSYAQVVCLDCRHTMARAALAELLEAANPGFGDSESVGGIAVAPDADAAVTDTSTFRVVDCVSCGGMLKPDIVYFGESVPKQRVEQAYALVDDADALLVAGSSLTVFSGYRFVRHAAARGVPVAIINHGRTRGDELATVKLDAGCSPILALLAGELGAPTDR